ncbi:hypothetical protein [Corallococcus terminator]|uniref:hypothetical protein n=1 Tax=Corallococcus terminator TaxID=2316733 RepID=UPI0011C34E3E|nr:hypothetical protein [Corallococcus terminator]
MNPSHSRKVLAVCVWSVLAPGCYLLPDAEAEGECRGNYLGKSVRWPLFKDGAWLERIASDRGGKDQVHVHLEYETQDIEDDVEAFGVDIRLEDGALIERPDTTKLVPKGNYGMGPQGESVVMEWSGRVWTSDESRTGYLRPGRPAEGTVTFERVNNIQAKGQFVYLYLDGSKLTCTFDTPKYSSSES